MAVPVALPEQECLRESGLADAAGSGGGHQPVLADQRGECRQLAVATDQRRQNARQVRLLRRGCRARRRRLSSGQSSCWPGVCSRRLGIDPSNEAVPKPRDRFDSVRAEQLAQDRHLLLEVVLLHHDIGPDGVQQFLLADQPAGPLGEIAQQIECAGAQGGQVTVDQQAPLARLQFEATG